MILAIAVSAFASLALPSFAATCAQDGSSYEYTETVSGSTRTVNFNVCPNHYFDMGNLNPNYAVSGGSLLGVQSFGQLFCSRSSSE